MPATVRLQDIVDALELQIDEASSFLDLDTGRVETVPDDFLLRAGKSDEDDPGRPEWENQVLEVAKRIATSDRFVPLPSKFDVNGWEIMQDFSLSVRSDGIREELLDAIRGRGVFRNFKAAVRRRDIEKRSFEFRTDALKQIAIDWCEENQIAWE